MKSVWQYIPTWTARALVIIGSEEPAFKPLPNKAPPATPTRQRSPMGFRELLSQASTPASSVSGTPSRVITKALGDKTMTTTSLRRQRRQVW